MKTPLRLCICAQVASWLMAQPSPALFEYDKTKLPKLECEELTQRRDAFVRGCAFAGPRGGQINLLLVEPKLANPPFAAVLFQHGGGQSMTNYLSEALLLAQSGVVSMLADAPARGAGVNSELNQTALEDSQRFQADVVVSLRMALDHLLRQKGVDARRAAFVGHSYGAVAGGALAGVEPRFRTFIFLGGIVSEADHIRDDKSPYWQAMRDRMTPEDFAKTIEAIRVTDPANYLPLAKAPVLVQCARFDTPANLAGCLKVHELAGGPKRLTRYDDDHHFTSWEAARDRMMWLADHLALKGVGKRLPPGMPR